MTPGPVDTSLWTSYHDGSVVVRLDQLPGRAAGTSAAGLVEVLPALTLLVGERVHQRLEVVVLREELLARLAGRLVVLVDQVVEHEGSDGDLCGEVRLDERSTDRLDHELFDPVKGSAEISVEPPAINRHHESHVQPPKVVVCLMGMLQQSQRICNIRI